MVEKISDLLMDEADRFINQHQNQAGGALYDWNRRTIEQFKDTPVETLLLDPYFLNLKGVIYDKVLEDIVGLWREREKRDVDVAVFLEAIGVGKTFKASVILWLLWFELCLHENPQKHFGLADNSIIAIMLLSRSQVQSKRVVFNNVWERFQSGFNKDYFPVNARYSNEIRIDRNNTCVYAGTSSALSILGYNAYAGVIDEANFLEVIDASSKSQSDTYDAGEDMYNALMNRMTSRFMKHGRIPGIIVLISSPLYPDSFLERKIEEGKSLGEEVVKLFWRRRSLWEGKGPKFFDLSKYFVVDTDTMEIIKEVN